jgi:hypothetical protein
MEPKGALDFAMQQRRDAAHEAATGTCERAKALADHATRASEQTPSRRIVIDGRNAGDRERRGSRRHAQQRSASSAPQRGEGRGRDRIAAMAHGARDETAARGSAQSLAFEAKLSVGRILPAST